MKSLAIISAVVLAASAAAPLALAQDGPGVGARVIASDGTTLGRLEGRRGQGDRMELMVRGEDGAMRAIPAAAVTPHGDMLHASWTAAQFRAAQAIMTPGAPGNAGSGGGNQGPMPNQNTADPAGGQPSASGVQEDATRPATPEQTQAPPPQA